jgi:hypothetical protein
LSDLPGEITLVNYYYAHQQHMHNLKDIVRENGDPQWCLHTTIGMAPGGAIPM